MSDSTARSRIFGAIRNSLDVQEGDEARIKVARKRLDRHPPNLLPERAQRAKPARIELFTKMLESQGAKVTRVKGTKQIPEIIAEYLRANNLPAELRSGKDPMLEKMPWKSVPSLTRHTGRGRDEDVVALSRAEVAAAETGTMFLLSGPDNPTTLNFLPDTHIAVIKAKDILGSYEDGWQRLREIYGPRTLPRTVNLISGPSRTADIEQTIVMGAHGPRRLHVIVVD